MDCQRECDDFSTFQLIKTIVLSGSESVHPSLIAIYSRCPARLSISIQIIMRVPDPALTALVTERPQSQYISFFF